LTSLRLMQLFPRVTRGMRRWQDRAAPADLNLRVDFGYASEHALAVAAKAIIAAFYGHRPAESYYDGCSQGGHEALLEAQRYPADFNVSGVSEGLDVV
jgi:Tannase and feruloyl esterase